MKATQVSKENGVVKFNIEFSAEEFSEAVNKAYLKNRSKFQIDGFRKGFRKRPHQLLDFLCKKQIRQHNRCLGSQ